MNANINPRVSIVLPTHNRPVLFREALDSVLQQTWTDWEVIVVDDASEPPVEPGQSDPRCRVIRHELARGGAAAKNTGIANARGEFVAYLDDDDCYDPRYIERAVEALDRHPDLGVVFMGVTWFGTNGAWGQSNYEQAMTRFLASAGGETIGTLTLFDENVLHALLRSVPMALQRPVVRKPTLDQIGGYRPDCLLWDCDWAIMAALNTRTALLSEGLYRQRADGQGYSSKRDRTVEQLLSGIDIKERLYRLSRTGIYVRHEKAFRRAVSDAWFDLAWHFYRQGKRRQALPPLLNSVGRLFRPGQVKLLLRLLLPSGKSGGEF